MAWVDLGDDRGVSLETHMRHVFDKLDVASRSEVTHLAFETGFIQPGDFE